jgi:cell division protein FtsL
MRSTTIITWIVFILPIALGLFYVKHVVANLENNLASLHKSIKSDKEEIHVLTAEWTYLSRPERIKQLSTKYLDLAPTKSTQVAELNQIPMANDGAVLSMTSYNAE